MGRGGPPREAKYTFATAWSNYVRATFRPKKFYCFPGLRNEADRVYLYVLEHKSLAGREAIPEDDAKARPLEVCFFTKSTDASPGELLVRRADSSTSSLVTHTYSPTEILVAAGLHVPSLPGQSPAEWEAIVEEHYRTTGRLVFEHEIVPDAPAPYMYPLSEPMDCEESYMAHAPLDQLTRMALARALERDGPTTHPLRLGGPMNP